MHRRSRRTSGLAGLVVAVAATLAPISAHAGFQCTTDVDVLNVNDTGLGDQILLGVSAGDIRVGETLAGMLTCGDVTEVNRINITMGPGADLVTLVNPAMLVPGATAEPSGASDIEVNVHGGPDADTLRITGGPGPFTIRAGASGMNWNGDDDVDLTHADVERFQFFGGNSANTILLGGSASTGGPFPSPAELRGGSASDRLVGGAAADVIQGFAGNDDMDGGDGVDRLVESGDVNLTIMGTSLLGMGFDSHSGFETATLSGGAGNNTLRNSMFGGSVTLVGGAGNDRLVGGPVNDRLEGGTGNDVFNGTTGDDVFVGGTGTDAISIVLYSGNATVSPGRLVATDFGTETFSSIEAVVVTGSAGVNRLQAPTFAFPVRFNGLGGNDVLVGGKKRDALIGGDGNDVLQGREENDALSGGNGSDGCNGGAGTDSASSCESKTQIP